jgi:hypothetical protein
VSGDVIVWIHVPSDGQWLGDVWAYNVEQKTAFPVCDNAADVFAPDVDGSTVVWEDERNGSANRGDIYAAELNESSTGVTRADIPVCVDVGQSWVPVVSAQTIVWRGANWSIYSVNLSALSGEGGAVGALSTKTAVSSSAPLTSPAQRRLARVKSARCDMSMQGGRQ